MPERDEPPRVDHAGRRRFLTMGVGGLGSALVAAALGPAVVVVAYPVRHAVVSDSDGYVPVGRSDRFAPDSPVKVDLYADVVDAYNRFDQQRIGAAWVVRRGSGLVAMSSVCPHLGCAIGWVPAARRFECPCHRSRFSIDGKIESGPSPRNMDRLDVAERDGQLSIRYQRFRQGLREKVPV